MNTIEQAREAAAEMRSGPITTNKIRNEWPNILDALVAELTEIKSQFEMSLEREVYWNSRWVSVSDQLASIKGQEPVGVVVRVDSAMAPGCSYLQGTMIKNTPDGALLYLAAGAYPAPCNPLCELCIKRGYTECANVTVTTPLPMLAQGQRKP